MTWSVERMRQKIFAKIASVETQAALWVGMAGLSSVLVLGNAGPAYALDDDGHENLFDTVMTMLAMTPGKAAEKPDIDYRERPPLVLPPKMDLRQPQEQGTSRSASWPQDPDVTSRKKAAAAAHWRGSPAKGNDALSKEELMAGRAAGGTAPAPEQRCGDRQHWCLYVNPDDMRSQSVPDTEAPTAAVGQEPEREYLTQPPKGYRVATKKVQPTFEAPIKDDAADPRAYWRKKTTDE
jgi:hypothetical protein